MIVNGRKRCARCGEDRPVAEFAKNRAQKDGLQGYCRKHMNEAWRRWTGRTG